MSFQARIVPDPGWVDTVTTNTDCEVTTNIVLADPVYMSTNWTVIGPDPSYTVSGDGLTATFDATHGVGQGTITFSVTYDAEPCSTTLHTISNTYAFTVVGPEGDCSTSPHVRLSLWNFQGSTSPAWLANDRGQLPLSSANIQQISYPSNQVLRVDTNLSATVRYAYYTNDGSLNFNCSHGAVAFWFKPRWNGGTGPGNYGRLFEIGYTNSTSGWMGMWVNPSGSQLSFGTKSNGVAATCLTQNISSWASNTWYHILVNYSSSQTTLYTNFTLAQTGSGLINYPSATSAGTYGLAVGADQTGALQARAEYDNLETFSCPLDPADISTYDFNVWITHPAENSSLP
ncbi:MAG: LamG-like jellyroll fold domain-containing protein [Limisphaerales bacterium]